MRILLLTSNSPFDEITGPLAAGAEYAMRRIGEKLAARGHQVMFVTLADGEQRTAVVNGVEVHVLPRQGFGRLKDLAFRFARRIRTLLAGRAEGRLTGLAHRRLDGMTVRQDQGKGSFLQRLRDLIDGREIDLIHCNSSLPDPLVSATVGRERGIPVVVRVGGRYWYLRHQRLLDAASQRRYLEQVRFAFGNSQCLAFNAETLRRQTAEMFDELGIESAAEQVVIDIGVAPPAEHSAVGDSLAALDAMPPGLLVSCIGKFKEDSKRQDLLVRALAMLGDEMPVTIAFAGDGPTQDSIEELALTEGVRDRVVFLGSLSHAAVFELLRRSDIVAQATEFEGSSKALAEAMLCGRALVASDVPAMHEHIEHGVNGLLATNTAESFADRLRQLGADEELRQRLGAAAKSYAERVFDPEAGVEEYERLFARLIGEKRSQGDSTSLGEA